MGGFIAATGRLFRVIELNVPVSIIENEKLKISQSLDPYMESSELAEAAQDLEDQFPAAEFTPLLNEMVDYKEWARAIIQSGKSASFFTSLRSKAFRELNDTEKFSLFYYNSDEPRRQRLFARVFQLLNENELPEVWVSYVDQNYEYLIRDLNEKIFRLTNKNIAIRFYETGARRFQQAAIRLRNAEDRFDSDEWTRNRIDAKVALKISFRYTYFV